MRNLSAFVAVAVVLGVALLVVPATAISCSGGLGDDQWCTRGENGNEAAHQTDSCPKVCQKKTCDDVRPAKGERRGIYLELGDDDDDDMGRGKDWEEIARSGLYEHVYAEDDKYVCLTTCWYQPWKAKCEKWEEAFGRKYCLHLNCEHDKYGGDGGNRFAGCHADDDGELKLDWHKPTCNECIQLFPACYDELESFADREDRKAVERLEDAVEVEAQEQCYNKYFKKHGGKFVAESSEAESSSGRRLMSSSNDDDDSGGLRDGLNGRSWSRQVADYAKDTVDNLMDKGDLDCPPAQCLSNDLELLLTYAGVSKPTPAPTPAPTQAFTGPWYHTITEGFCAWTCDDTPMANIWCSRSVENCMICKSTWCPPSKSLPWDPVTLDNYEPKPEWYEVTTEGFCAWNDNCNTAFEAPNPWCDRSVDNCLTCTGTWCPPPEMTGTWQPVSRPQPEPVVDNAEAVEATPAATAMTSVMTEMPQMPMATAEPAMAPGPAEMEEMPMATAEPAMAPGPAEMEEMEEMPMATAEPAMAPGLAEMEEMPMATAEPAMAPGPAEMEEMPMAAAESAMAPGPAEMEEMPMAAAESAMAPGPAEMEQMPTDEGSVTVMAEETDGTGVAMSSTSMEPAAMAPAAMVMEDMEMIAEAPGPAGTSRRMLSTGEDTASSKYFQALRTFADKSQCSGRISKDVKMRDFLDR